MIFLVYDGKPGYAAYLLSDNTVTGQPFYIANKGFLGRSAFKNAAM